VKGSLYIVSTPIGNLEDITLRALRVLKEVDIIAAEDTRHSLKLLNHYGISKPMVSYWKEREQVRSDEIMRKLLSGQSVALISDAGTPGISDPGSVLIQKAIEEHIQIIPIPGAAAFVSALSLSGLPTDKFTFLGFLPARKTQRRKVLKELSLERRTLIFYEAPHRIVETLTDMEMVFTGREAAVAKEITKIHEEFVRGSIPEIIAALSKSKIAGEYVIVVEGLKEEGKHMIDDVLPEVLSLMRKGLRRKEAVRRVSDIYGLSKKELYDRSLKDEIA
jgi:16S rRNA (cytidine1402-2'-O)-methyltransferase